MDFNGLEIIDFSLHIASQQNKAVILENIDFELKKDECVALVGVSGAGKSMLLKSILKLYENIHGTQTSGEILIKNGNVSINILDTSDEEIEKQRKNNIALIFQQSSKVLNPVYNIRQQLDWYNIDNCDLHKLLSEVGFSDTERILNKYPHELSGGQIQRILIALALITNPFLLLVDEPTSNLDESLKIRILDLLFKIQKERQISMLIVSHNLNLIEKYCEKIVVIDQGKISAKGSIKELKKLQNPQIQKLFGNGINFNAELIEESAAQESILNIKNLSFKYGKKEDLVLQDFNLILLKNEILGLVGDSGSGKSTLAKLISGLYDSSSGEILFDGIDIKKMSNNQFENFRRGVQLIFQDPLNSLPPHRTVKSLMKEMIKIHKAELNPTMLSEYISNFGLGAEVLNKTPRQLSGGQRQRVFIARALIAKPQLLICDEIFSSLDQFNQANLINLILSLKEKFKFSIIFISHNKSLTERISHKIIQLDSLN